jgi:hypothetical protein
MKLTTKARVTSAVLLGVAGGIAHHFYELKEFGIGREAFLAAQAVRYDRVEGLHHPLAAAVVAFVLIAGAVVGSYELLTFVVAKILARTGGEHRAEGS